jgi:hypothetical protein
MPSNAAGPISGWLSADHARLDGFLTEATAADPIDPGPYAEFRRGLLRHIAIEEKILLPAAQRAQNGGPLALAARLRLDHGAIAALLVPTPTPAIVATMRDILTAHNALEEEPGGVYALCDVLLAGNADAIVREMASHPDVRLSPHNDGPGVLAALRRALERAGYRLRDDADDLARAGQPPNQPGERRHPRR